MAELKALAIIQSTIGTTQVCVWKPTLLAQFHRLRIESMFDLLVNASFAWGRFVHPLPGAAQLACGTVSALFGHAFHIQARFAK
jgi:hypothetical protein